MELIEIILNGLTKFAFQKWDIKWESLGTENN